MNLSSTSRPPSYEQESSISPQLSGRNLDLVQSSLITSRSSRVISTNESLKECVDGRKQIIPSNQKVRAFDQIQREKVALTPNTKCVSFAVLSWSPRSIQSQIHNGRSFEEKEPQVQPYTPFPSLPQVPVEVKTKVSGTGDSPDKSKIRKTPNLTVIIEGEILVKPFPLLVHEMLSQADPTFIEWTEDGSAFKMLPRCEKQPRKTNNILQNFSLPKLPAFHAELYSYGWNNTNGQQNQGNSTKIFYHSTFHKDADLSDIARIPKKKKKICKKRIGCSSAAKSDPKLGVTPSGKPPKKRRVQAVTTIVPRSPISVEYAPLRRAKLIPISPIEFSSDVYDEIEKADSISTIVNNDFEYNFDRLFDVEDQDEDSNSEVSVPLTPLSINVQEALGIFTEGTI